MAGRKAIQSQMTFQARPMLTLRASRRDVEHNSPSTRLIRRLEELRQDGSLGGWLLNAALNQLAMEEQGAQVSQYQIRVDHTPRSISPAVVHTPASASSSQVPLPAMASAKPDAAPVELNVHQVPASREEIIEDALQALEDQPRAVAEEPPQVKPPIKRGFLAMGGIGG